MKKSMLILLAVVSFLGLSAQTALTLTEGKPVVVYSLPKTEFCIVVHIEKTTQKPGQFYQYSERYLATNQVITEEITTFKLKNIFVSTNAIPDPKRTYQFENNSNLKNNYITVDNCGILQGVNVPVVSKETHLQPHNSTEKSDIQSKSLLPLGEEYLMAGSTAKLAEGVAKQIYRIRESRMTLLSGEMDNPPSDGKALTSMLKGLDKSETELTELFTGKVIVDNQSYIIRFTPDSAVTNHVLFRISALRGFVEASDLSGIPYYLNITSEKISITPPDPKSKPEKTVLNTILPANAKVTLSDGITTYFEREFPVPQFGVIVPVSENLLKTTKIKIKIDNQTGRLIGIEK